MKSKELKTYNLPQDQEIIHQLEVKPYAFLVTVLVLGIAYIFYNGSIALVLMSLSLYALFFLPDRKLLIYTEEYMVMQNKAAKDDCIMIYYDEIVSWQYLRSSKVDTLVVELEDGTLEKIDCFSKRRVTKYMEEFAPHKQIKTKRSI